MAMAAYVLHNWCIIADDTDIGDFPELSITLDAHMNISAEAAGEPNTTSGNAKRALLVDCLSRR